MSIKNYTFAVLLVFPLCSLASNTSDCAPVNMRGIQEATRIEYSGTSIVAVGSRVLHDPACVISVDSENLLARAEPPPPWRLRYIPLINRGEVRELIEAAKDAGLLTRDPSWR